MRQPTTAAATQSTPTPTTFAAPSASPEVLRFFSLAQGTRLALSLLIGAGCMQPPVWFCSSLYAASRMSLTNLPVVPALQSATAAAAVSTTAAASFPAPKPAARAASEPTATATPKPTTAASTAAQPAS